MKKFLGFLVLITVLILAAGPASSIKIDFKEIFKELKESAPGPVGQPNVGLASYYSDKYVGRMTSNGEIFTQQKYTAAHKTLPFGTKVKVINMENGKEVIVIINDRGPFKTGRVIDLTKTAAKELGMLGSGVVKVRLETL